MEIAFAEEGKIVKKRKQRWHDFKKLKPLLLFLSSSLHLDMAMGNWNDKSYSIAQINLSKKYKL